MKFVGAAADGLFLPFNPNLSRSDVEAWWWWDRL